MPLLSRNTSSGVTKSFCNSSSSVTVTSFAAFDCFAWRLKNPSFFFPGLAAFVSELILTIAYKQTCKNTFHVRVIRKELHLLTASSTHCRFSLLRYLWHSRTPVIASPTSPYFAMAAVVTGMLGRARELTREVAVSQFYFCFLLL